MQLDALEQILSKLSSEEAFRVLLIHHPLRSNSRVKRLTDSSKLLALLKQYGVELILHGHDHVHSTIGIDGPKGSIPAIGVPSASAVAHGRYPGAAYNLFSIERDGDAWRCEQTIRGIDDKLRVQELRRTARPRRRRSPAQRSRSHGGAVFRSRPASPASPPAHAHARPSGGRHSR